MSAAPLIGHDGIEAVADEVYRALGIRGGPEEMDYAEFKARREALLADRGLDPEGVLAWCLEEGKADAGSHTQISLLPMMIVMECIVPALCTAYECGIIVGVELGARLTASAPDEVHL